MAGCLESKRPVGEPRRRWEVAVVSDAVDILPMAKWKAATRKREGWRQKSGKAMARKRAEAPYNNNKNNEEEEEATTTTG